ncbi:NUDIX domain-containing protein [Brevibacillus nitrificans]|uniref:NUDIX domain-containing protein n=1 Tax=Brevibacillus nitrificans TaxID=651560 RepID=UPI002864A030|nr:NUDIX domain-containing protein [Brevibacillus nitrificans]MDR7314530.1 8-oxo-dGTP pyrophosphatase MutT (NUDIX family) [Brevibacillus nitrificans]
MSYPESYVGQVRKLVGHNPLIVPSIRAIICDEAGKVLFTKGNGRWGMPAGSIELGESIYETLQREVKEETGLEVVSATLIAIYSGKPMVENSYHDKYQLFEFLFKVDSWEGELLSKTDETTDADFFAIDSRPVVRNGFWGEHFTEVFEDYQNYKGTLILK